MRKQQEEKLKKLKPVLTDSIEVVQIAEGISCEICDNLQRMRELAEQVASGTLSKEECDALQAENEQRQQLMDYLTSGADMNRVKPHLSSGNMILQVGESKEESISFPFQEMSSTALGVDASKVNISTPENATDAVAFIDAALERLSSQGSTLNAVQNRLEHVLK